MKGRTFLYRFKGILVNLLKTQCFEMNVKN